MSTEQDLNTAEGGWSALNDGLGMTGVDYAKGYSWSVIECLRCKSHITIENGDPLPEMGWCRCNLDYSA
jgi:hypothetical protein